LSANLKNAFDKTYYVGGTAIAQLLDYNTALPGAPRTFTIQAQYKF
jgi:iron complex outermembrane receptor protein